MASSSNDTAKLIEDYKKAKSSGQLPPNVNYGEYVAGNYQNSANVSTGAGDQTASQIPKTSSGQPLTYYKNLPGEGYAFGTNPTYNSPAYAKTIVNPSAPASTESASATVSSPLLSSTTQTANTGQSAQDNLNQKAMQLGIIKQIGVEPMMTVQSPYAYKGSQSIPDWNVKPIFENQSKPIDTLTSQKLNPFYRPLENAAQYVTARFPKEGVVSNVALFGIGAGERILETASAISYLETDPGKVLKAMTTGTGRSIPETIKTEFYNFVENPALSSGKLAVDIGTAELTGGASKAIVTESRLLFRAPEIISVKVPSEVRMPVTGTSDVAVSTRQLNQDVLQVSSASQQKLRQEALSKQQLVVQTPFGDKTLMSAQSQSGLSTSNIFGKGQLKSSEDLIKLDLSGSEIAQRRTETLLAEKNKVYDFSTSLPEKAAKKENAFFYRETGINLEKEVPAALRVSEPVKSGTLKTEVSTFKGIGEETQAKTFLSNLEINPQTGKPRTVIGETYIEKGTPEIMVEQTLGESRFSKQSYTTKPTKVFSESVSKDTSGSGAIYSESDLTRIKSPKSETTVSRAKVTNAFDFKTDIMPQKYQKLDNFNTELNNEVFFTDTGEIIKVSRGTQTPIKFVQPKSVIEVKGVSPKIDTALTSEPSTILEKSSKLKERTSGVSEQLRFGARKQVTQFETLEPTRASRQKLPSFEGVKLNPNSTVKGLQNLRVSSSAMMQTRMSQITSGRSNASTESKLRIMQDTGNDIMFDLKPNIKTSESSILKSSSASVQASSAASKLRLDSKQDLVSQLRFSNPTMPRVSNPQSPRFRFDVPFMRKPIGEDTKFGNDSEPQGAFDVYVRERKKLIKVNTKPQSYKAAENLGGYYTDNTPTKTFTLKRSAGVAGKPETSYSFNPNKYKQKSPSVLIEKSKYAIDTPGEVQGITVKGLMARKKRFGAFGL